MIFLSCKFEVMTALSLVPRLQKLLMQDVLVQITGEYVILEVLCRYCLITSLRKSKRFKFSFLLPPKVYMHLLILETYSFYPSFNRATSALIAPLLGLFLP